ncbi:MAG: M28 family peptidase [Acidimicrobiia bacterium]
MATLKHVRVDTSPEGLGGWASEIVTCLCSVVPDRRPGSPGNSRATAYVADQLSHMDWPVEQPEFACVDWRTDGGSLTVGGRSIDVPPSPYGCGVSAVGPLRILRNREDLQRQDLGGAVVVLDGGLASEPLTPKAYPFYGSDEHAALIGALESAAPAAVIAITGRYPALCGALDPFPLIEDGDFAIPTGNIRPDESAHVLASDGEPSEVELRSERWTATARNIVATRGCRSARLTVAAHIDTKPGTPGAVDNAAGVAVVVLLAGLLSPERHPSLGVGLELLVVNGEDHYAAPGEVAWLSDNKNTLDDVALFINIDGAGYCGGRTAYSTYNVAANVQSRIDLAFGGREDLVEGPAWYQSDHAIFAMQGRPALAFTTEHVDEMLESLFHAPTDTPDQVDAALVVGIATALEDLVVGWSD